MHRRSHVTAETERKHLRSSDADSKQYQAVSRVRNRIDDELATDIGILREHHPELYAELREIVCDDEE
ncbi:hypothetical protein EXE40_09455 [Halorubrum sp. GN11GM_10-3_MGM]|nr:hypothetical protein EXE40_09455 [Halorubrum sp. GN11GM_10-3_MGM]